MDILVTLTNGTNHPKTNPCVARRFVEQQTEQRVFGQSQQQQTFEPNYFGIWYSYLAKSKRVAGTFGGAR